MTRKIVAVFIFGIFLTGATFVAAQGAGPGAVKYKKRTVYDFDDDLVETELNRPDGEYIDTRRGAKHSLLIKIRTDFIPELLKTAEDI